MNYRNIACFDVYYYKDYAKASCIVFEIKTTERIINNYIEIVKPVKKYIPGEFYRRELPCILKVYNKVKEDIHLILVDGYVFLGNGKMGLGAYLFKALDSKIPIIGVAKTFF